MQISINTDIVQKVLQLSSTEILQSEEASSLLLQHGQEVSTFPQQLWDLGTVVASALLGDHYLIWEVKAF